MALNLQGEIVLVNHFKVKDSFKFGSIHVKRMTITPGASDVLKAKILDFVKDKIEETFGSKPILAYDGRDSLYSNGTFPFGTLSERYYPPPLQR